MTINSNIRPLSPLDFQGMASLRASASQSQDDATVKETAQQFEALFIQMMLKSMRDAVPEGGLLESSNLDMYQEMHDQQIAMEMSRDGGIGLAKMIEAQLQQKQVQQK